MNTDNSETIFSLMKAQQRGQVSSALKCPVCGRKKSEECELVAGFEKLTWRCSHCQFQIDTLAGSAVGTHGVGLFGAQIVAEGFTRGLSAEQVAENSCLSVATVVNGFKACAGVLQRRFMEKRDFLGTVELRLFKLDALSGATACLVSSRDSRQYRVFGLDANEASELVEILSHCVVPGSRLLMEKWPAGRKGYTEEVATCMEDLGYESNIVERLADGLPGLEQAANFVKQILERSKNAVALKEIPAVRQFLARMWAAENFAGREAELTEAILQFDLIAAETVQCTHIHPSRDCEVPLTAPAMSPPTVCTAELNDGNLNSPANKSREAENKAKQSLDKAEQNAALERAVARAFASGQQLAEIQASLGESQKGVKRALNKLYKRCRDALARPLPVGKVSLWVEFLDYRDAAHNEDVLVDSFLLMLVGPGGEFRTIPGSLDYLYGAVSDVRAVTARGTEMTLHTVVQSWETALETREYKDRFRLILQALRSAGIAVYPSPTVPEESGASRVLESAWERLMEYVIAAEECDLQDVCRIMDQATTAWLAAAGGQDLAELLQTPGPLTLRYPEVPPAPVAKQEERRAFDSFSSEDDFLLV